MDSHMDTAKIPTWSSGTPSAIWYRRMKKSRTQPQVLYAPQAPVQLQVSFAPPVQQQVPYAPPVPPQHQAPYAQQAPVQPLVPYAHQAPGQPQVRYAQQMPAQQLASYPSQPPYWQQTPSTAKAQNPPQVTSQPPSRLGQVHFAPMVQRPSNNAGLSGYAQVSASTGLTSSGVGLGAVQGTLNPRARTPLTAIVTYGGCRATTSRFAEPVERLAADRRTDRRSREYGDDWCGAYAFAERFGAGVPWL
ncbi:hypothetical protein PC114_g20293 [Phytophthora cactorum]|nr:hypothetical protein PC114_g20293 [Phytophthora cactorum]